MKFKSLCLLLPLFVLASVPAHAAEPAAATQAPASPLRGYGGIGLMLESVSLSTPGGDTGFTGGGLIFNGAGAYDTGGDVGMGFNGQLAFGSSTNNDDTSVSSTGVLFGFDGGILLAKMFYLSLGMQIQNDTPDNFDVTQTYFVIPLGLGMLWTADDGYGLVQLRFGGGQVSNDSSNDTEDVGMFGIRIQGQTGTAKSLQFMGGLEMENYSWSSIDYTDFRFRAFFGLGFGG